MTLKYIIYELKKWIRDPMMIFMLAYPLIIASVVRFGIPVAEEQFLISVQPFNHVIAAVIMLLTSSISGAIIGFSILDDRDDKILYAIDVSPVSFDMYMGFRFIMSFSLTYIGSIVALLISGIGGIPLYALLLVPMGIGLFSSVLAMFINFFATNKVEGFAMMKAGAMIIVFPVASLFFTDFKEFFFGFEPNFWVVKALSVAMLPTVDWNLGFWGYFPVGVIYALALNAVVYHIFKRRIII